MFKTSILEIGQRLGKYHIISELGRGGMGCVYLAEDETLNRRVAIKVIQHHEGADDSFVEKLAHEAKLIANLAHPNVVHVNSFDVIAGIPIIEMEYIKGGSLARRFQDEFVLPAEAVRYAYGVSNALAFSHSMGAIHRDVKPSNILIDHHEQARLADFGIAKAIADSEMNALTNSRSGMFRGTPHYAPPEAWEGEEPTESWDIYSLGAVLYEAVTGTTPHVAATPLELARKMATEEVEPARALNPKISAELGALIDEQLMGDASDRPEDAGEVAARLELIPEFGLDVDHKQSTVRFQLPKTTRPRRFPKPAGQRIVWYVSCAALLALGVFLALWWESGTRAIWMRALGEQVVPASDGQPGMPHQDLSSLAGGAGLESLFHATKINTDQIVMTARFPERLSNVTEQWLVTLSEAKLPVAILGHGQKRLAQMTLEERADGFDVAGNWAGYGDVQGTVFRRGTILGRLYWQDGSKILLGSLSFLGDHDGSLQESTVSAARSETTKSDTQFIYRFEESEFLAALIYNELRPRGDSWVDDFERLMPSFAGGVVTIETSAEKSRARADHSFDYAALRHIVAAENTLPPNILVGIPRRSTPLAGFVHESDRMTAVLACNRPAESDDFHLDLEFARTFYVPLSATPTLRLVYHARDDVLYEYYGQNDVPPSSSSACTVVTERQGDTVVFRVTIPYAAFKMNSDAPRSGERMRFSAKVEADDDHQQSRIVAEWGFPSDGAVKHGAVLHFKQ